MTKGPQENQTTEQKRTSIKMRHIYKEIHYAMTDVTVEGNCIVIKVPYKDNKLANKVFQRIIDVADNGA